MNKSTVLSLSLAIAAGTTCSLAQQAEIPVDRIREAHIVGTVAPSTMIYKGRQYPVRLHNGGSDTNNVDIYNNAPSTGGFYTTSLPNNHFMDEVSFFPGPGEGAAQLINGVYFTFGFNPAAPLDVNHSVAVRFRIWDTLNPLLGTATQNVSDQDGTITFIFAAPATGWTVNAFYNTGMIDISTITGGGIQTLDDAITVELLMLTTDVNNQPTTTINTEMTSIVATTGFAQTVGSSPYTYWRDVLNDDIWQSGDARTFAYPTVAGIVYRLQAKVNTPLTGACCLPGGSCSVITSYECTTNGGAYQGDNSACGTCNSPGVLVANGPLSTGATTGSGVAAPGTGTWSELPTDGITSNTTTGLAIGDTAAPAFRCADNFTITDPTGWDVKDIVFYAYQTTTSAFSQSTIKSGTLQIWNGPPNAGGSVVFGDATTNRLAASTFSGIWRTGNTTVPAAAPTVARPVFENWLTANTHLAPGTYWVDAQFHCTLPFAGTVTNAAFAPFQTTAGVRGPAGANALQMTAANTWANATDGSAGTPAQEFPFIVRGNVTTSACYANCDNSTTPPILNANDFQCFLNKFAVQDPTANCDGSTTAPTLNANDFQCFLNAYAAGCS